MRVATRAFKVVDFWHFKTIAAAKSSGKFHPKLRKTRVVKELLSASGGKL
jgi:hypothetical protein